MASQEGSEPETDSPDIYAYVKDLVSPGVRTRLWDCVDVEHEGCVLLRGLHVVPQACLGESQQLWVSGCVCVLSTRERPSSARPASPLLPLTAPPHRGILPSFLPLFLLRTPLPFFLSSLPQSPPFRSSPLPCPFYPLPGPCLARGSPPGTPPAPTALTCR